MLKVHTGAEERPAAFEWNGRVYEVEDVVDQWFGRADRFFKIRAQDGDLYILKLDEGTGQWDVVAYRRE